MTITVEIKPCEIEGLVTDMMSGKVLGSLSRGTSDLAYKLLNLVQDKLNELDTECETMRPFIEQFFCGYRETEGTAEDEHALFEQDGKD